MCFSSRVLLNRFHKRRMRLRAFTLIETLAAAFILMLLVVASMSMFGTGTTLYAQTSRSAFTEADVARASRTIESELAQACDYTVSADGKKVTYYLLATVTDASNYKTPKFPPVKDLTVHTFTVLGTNAPYTLQWSDKPNNPILTGMPSSAVFGPAGVQSNGVSAALLTATLVSEQSYSVGKGVVRTVRQTAITRVIPRNVGSVSNYLQ